MNKSQKLDGIITLLREYNWTINDLLEAWVDDEHEIESHMLWTGRLRRATLDKTSVVRYYLDQVHANIPDELTQLVTMSPFNQFDFKESYSMLEDFDFDSATEIIKTHAPDWYKLLSSILFNTRSHQPSHNASLQTEKKINKRMFTITSIVCFSRSKKSSNVLASMLATYLHGLGTKRRAIEVLAGIGLCQSYHQTIRNVDQVADITRVSDINS